MLNETILNTQTVYEGDVVNLDVHTVQMPDGATAVREVIRHSGASAVLPIDAEGRVLLVRQFRLAAGSDLLEIPAGRLDEGEHPRECAIREMREETGYKPHELAELGAFFVAVGYSTEKIHLFLGRQLEPAPLAMDDDEIIQIERVPFQEAVAMAQDGRLVDSKTIIALLRAARQGNLTP